MGSFAWASVEPWGEQPPFKNKQWVLQLGYFAELQNALDYKDRLVEVGFEAQTIMTGEPGEQHYRVIVAYADQPEDFERLQDALESRMGTRGYVLRNPYLGQEQTAENQDEVFEQPPLRALLAQAGAVQPMGGESVGSTATAAYGSNIFRTPSEEIDSIPGFTLAGLQIIPTIGLSIGYDDNITLSNHDEQDSFFYVISPAIRVELPSDRSILSLTAAMEITRYKDSKTDNRESWYVRGQWAWDPSTRQDFNLFAQYSEGSDKRGTGRRQGDDGLIPLAPDDWKRLDYGGMWRYGAIGARGKLDLKLGASTLEYTNFRDSTQLLDRDWWYFGASFYWRVAPRTSAVVDYLYTDISYDLSDNDSEETSWMLGLDWDASARTSGSIRYGNQKKKSRNSEFEDYSGPTWAASINWRPRTYSLFTLTGTRQTQEPDGNAHYVVRQDISLAWSHDWATRFGTVVDVGYGEDDYRPNVRTDDLFYWGVGARYTFNPHLRFGASIHGYDRDSEIEEFNYKKHVYLLTLEASF
jgi:hypothetical protein